MGGEDLDGYAGAGLYDSVPMDETEERPVDYSSDPLLTDSGFQHKMMVDILRVGAAIERSLGSPQDIEGCIDSEGRVIVVQTRPRFSAWDARERSSSLIVFNNMSCIY